MSFSFSPNNAEKITQLLKRYPQPQALVLPTLWMAQYQEGHISLDAIEAISVVTKTPAMEVYRVATFYTMFHLEATPKKRVLVCKTLSCMLCGSRPITEHLKTKALEVEEVECLGSCGTAPVMQIDDIYYENLTNEKVDTILEKLL